MSYRTVLVSLNELRRLDEIIAAAVKLGRTFEAHLQGVFVIPRPPFYLSLGIAGIADAFEAQHRYFRDNAERARDRFETALAREGVKGSVEIVDSQDTLIWNELVERAVACDLVLVSQTRRDVEKGVEDYYAEEIIMRSGRPVIVLPFSGKADLDFGEIAIGWNGKREAARAVFDSLPILSVAKKVRILTIAEASTQPDQLEKSAERLAGTLQRHGVRCELERLEAEKGSAARQLLQHAGLIGAGLTVMGAYGHTRSREYVFGGATFEMLLAMQRPVLMAN
jgi:nucleotide-binding universal stress UspA family protein